MYENGEISSDAMAYMEAIWGLSDEDWKKLEEEYSNGNISKEDFEALQEIRDIPEEWVTEDNLNKGLNIGMRNGAWEGIQLGLGSYLNNWSSGISKLKTIFTRVGTDVTFAGFDTAYKAWVDSDVTGGSFEESWDELGGWTSTGIKVGIAFLASVANEIGTYFKDKNGIILETTEDFINKDSNSSASEYDELPIDKKIEVAKEKMKKYFEGHKNYGISEKRVDEAFNRIVICSSDAEFEKYYAASRRKQI